MIFLKKLNKLKYIIDKINNKIKNITKKIISFIFFIKPIDKNKIVLCNFYGKGYGCNPKYIVQEILRQKLNYKLIWLVESTSNVNDIPKEIKTVKYGSIKALNELITAKVWIDNSRKDFYPPKKRKGQYYIQTWHGGVGIKSVEKAVEDKLSKKYIKNAKNDSKMADLFLSNSKWCTELYRKNFWYYGEILECGSPRVDILFNSNIDIKEKVFKFYNIKKNKKILMYAPTFRNSMSLDIYNLDYESCINEIRNKFGGEWIVFIRLHPNMYHLSERLSKNSFDIINVTKYDDMQELLAISDILITDFSSSMFEFSYLKKPVFIFAQDYNEYLKERQLSIDLDRLPFKFTKSNEELIDEIKQFNQEKYCKNIEKMIKDLGIKENGNASKIVLEKIKEII